MKKLNCNGSNNIVRYVAKEHTLNVEKVSRAKEILDQGVRDTSLSIDAEIHKVWNLQNKLHVALVQANNQEGLAPLYDALIMSYDKCSELVGALNTINQYRITQG